MYFRTECIGKIFGPRDHLVTKNSKYVNDAKKSVNLR
jgi:hypothetical protein